MRRKNSFPFLTHPTNLPKAQTVAWVIYPNHTNPNHLFYPAQEFAAPHFSNQRQTVFQRNAWANIFYYWKASKNAHYLPPARFLLLLRASHTLQKTHYIPYVRQV